MDSDDDSLDGSQLEAELERQLAEMSDVDLQDGDDCDDNDDDDIVAVAAAAGDATGGTVGKAAVRLRSNEGGEPADAAAAADDLGHLALPVLPAAIQAIATRYRAAQHAAPNRAAFAQKRKELWYELQVCDNQRDNIIAEFRGDLVEVKAMLTAQERREQEEKELHAGQGVAAASVVTKQGVGGNGAADEVADGGGQPIKHAPLKKASPAVNGGSCFDNAGKDGDNTAFGEEPQLAGRGANTPTPTPTPAPTLDAAQLSELAEHARGDLSSVGAELLDTQNRRVEEDRQQNAAEGEALERLVEQNRAAQQLARQAEAEAQARIDRRAAEARRLLEEQFRQAQLERERAATAERQRQQRYEEEVRHMREVSQRARARREAATVEAARREEARQRAILKLKADLFRQGQCARHIHRAWRVFVLRRRAARFLQASYRIARARAVAGRLRTERWAATAIQGLYRRAQARRLRTDLAARKRMKMRLEREQRKRREMAERKQRERERRRQLRLLEQADARTALREAMGIAAQRESTGARVLEAAIEQFLKIVFPQRNAGTLLAASALAAETATAAPSTGEDDEALLEAALNQRATLVAESRRLDELRESTAAAAAVRSDLAARDEVADEALQHHSAALRDLERRLATAAAATTAAATAALAGNSSATSQHTDESAERVALVFQRQQPAVVAAEAVLRSMRADVAAVDRSLRRVTEIAEAADLGHFDGGARGLFAALEAVSRRPAPAAEDTGGGDSRVDAAASSLAMKTSAVKQALALAGRAVRSYAENEQRQLAARVQGAVEAGNLELLQRILADEEEKTKENQSARARASGTNAGSGGNGVGMSGLQQEFLAGLQRTLQLARDTAEKLRRDMLQAEQNREREEAERRRVEQEARRRQTELDSRRRRQLQQLEEEAAAAASAAEDAQQQQQRELAAARERERVQREEAEAQAEARPELAGAAAVQARLPSADKLRSLVSANRTRGEAGGGRAYTTEESAQAARVQAVFRGSRIRRRFAAARREIENLWDGDDDDFGEVDVDAFLDLGASGAGALGDDPDWMNEVFDEIGQGGGGGGTSDGASSADCDEAARPDHRDDAKSHRMARWDADDGDLSPAAAPSLGHRGGASSVADAAARSHRRREKGGHPKRHQQQRRRLPPLSPTAADGRGDGHRGGGSDASNSSADPSAQQLSKAERQAAILNEWGFSDPTTAHHMLKRQRKFERAAGKHQKKTTGRGGRSQRRRPAPANKHKRQLAKRRYDQLMAHMGLATGRGGGGGGGGAGRGSGRNGNSRANSGAPANRDSKGGPRATPAATGGGASAASPASSPLAARRRVAKQGPFSRSFDSPPTPAAMGFGPKRGTGFARVKDDDATLKRKYGLGAPPAQASTGHAQPAHGQEQSEPGRTAQGRVTREQGHVPVMVGSWLSDLEAETDVRLQHTQPLPRNRNLPPITAVPPAHRAHRAAGSRLEAAGAAVIGGPRQLRDEPPPRRVSSASAADLSSLGGLVLSHRPLAGGSRSGHTASSSEDLSRSLTLLENMDHLPRGGARGLLPRRATTAEGY